MAKKQKSGKKRVGASVSQPTALLYRLDEGTQRGDAVRAVLASQGIRVKTVALDQVGNPVGALAGLPGFRMSRTPYVGQAPESEFMLLANVGNAQLNALLAAMREAGCSVGSKAQVTQYNRLWPFATLVAEVSREHEFMNSQIAEDQL